LRGPDDKPLTGFKDRAVVEFDGVRIGLTGATYDDTPRASRPEDLKFLPTVATAKEQAEALRRESADFVVAVVHASRKQDYELFATRAVDLVLTGHDHDLFINYDGRNAMVESSSDADYVTAINVVISVKTEGGQRETVWWSQFRVIDTATVTPIRRSPPWPPIFPPRSHARWTCRSPPQQSNSTAGLRPCVRARLRSGTSLPTPCAQRGR
jgi:2',3'-cyclic-nucleotide 2'-phosphodiesterase (5'-nucleotidase family)